MAENLDLRNYALTVRIEAFGTAGQSHVAAPMSGYIREIHVAVNEAVGGANETFSAKIEGTAVTNSSILHVTAGSAEGDVLSSYPSAANYVVAGQAIEIETAGTSNNTGDAVATIVIERA